MGKSLVFSAARAVVQLLLVGQILGFVFGSGSFWLTLGYLLWMIGAAVWVLSARLGPKKVHALRSLDLVGVMAGLSVSAIGLLQLARLGGAFDASQSLVESPAVIIPFVGIVLGNILTSLGLAVERLQSDIKSSRGLIESRLLAGQSASEAVTDFKRTALAAGLTPILNALSAAGIVSLPGALTGQLLAGQDPAAAVKVQILVLLSLALASWFGCAVLLGLLVRRWQDPVRSAFSERTFQ